MSFNGAGIAFSNNKDNQHCVVKEDTSDNKLCPNNHLYKKMIHICVHIEHNAKFCNAKLNFRFSLLTTSQHPNRKHADGDA